MYKFEWNYDIKNQQDFDRVVANINAEKDFANYEQLARLFYKGAEDTVMIELQVPTADKIEEHNQMWLDCYKVEDLDDYNASNEIGTTYGELNNTFTFSNTEQLMLEYAKGKVIMANTKTTFIVKSTEEDIGEEYFKVTVPEGTPEEEVMAKFGIAAKYADACFNYYAEKEDYDEHFDDMLEYYENSHGQARFDYYLEHFCGYKVEPLTYDFVYEW